MGSKTNARPHVLMGKCLFPNLIPRGRMQTDTKKQNLACVPTRLCALTSAPLWHRRLTTSNWPVLAAWIRPVLPVCAAREGCETDKRRGGRQPEQAEAGGVEGRLAANREAQ